HLFWVTFSEKVESQVETTPTKRVKDIGDETATTGQMLVEIQLNWSEYFKGQWTSRKQSGFNRVYSGSNLSEFNSTFRAEVSNDFDINDVFVFGSVESESTLQIGLVCEDFSCYFNVTNKTNAPTAVRGLPAFELPPYLFLHQGQTRHLVANTFAMQADSSENAFDKHRPVPAWLGRQKLLLFTTTTKNHLNFWVKEWGESEAEPFGSDCWDNQSPPLEGSTDSDPAVAYFPGDENRGQVFVFGRDEQSRKLVYWQNTPDNPTQFGKGTWRGFENGLLEKVQYGPVVAFNLDNPNYVNVFYISEKDDKPDTLYHLTSIDKGETWTHN